MACRKLSCWIKAGPLSFLVCRFLNRRVGNSILKHSISPSNESFPLAPHKTSVCSEIKVNCHFRQFSTPHFPNFGYILVHLFLFLIDVRVADDETGFLAFNDHLAYFQCRNSLQKWREGLNDRFFPLCKESLRSIRKYCIIRPKVFPCIVFVALTVVVALYNLQG